MSKKKGEFVDLFRDLAAQGLLARDGRRRHDPARRTADAEEAGQARHLGRRRPARRRPRPARPAHRLARDRAAAHRRARADQLRRRDRSRGMGARSPRSCRAPTSIRSSSPRSSRARSRSTRRSVPAPSAPGSARACRSTKTCCSATRSLSITEGVILPWTSQGKSLYNYYEKLLDGLARDLGFSLDTPWEDLPAEARAAVLRGDNFEVKVRWRNRYGREMSYTSGFEGVVPYIERQYVQAETDVAARALGRVPPRGAVPGVRRQAAEARGALGAHPRPQHRRRRAAQPHRCALLHGSAPAHRARADHRRPGAARDQGSASTS